MNKITEFSQTVIPETVLRTASLSAYYQLFFGMMLLIFAILSIFGIFYSYKKMLNAREKEGWVILIFLICFSTIILSISSFYNLLDPIAWESVNRPELWIARKTLNL